MTKETISVGWPVDHAGNKILGPCCPALWRNYETINLRDLAPLPASNQLGPMLAWRRGRAYVQSSLICSEFRGEWKWQYVVSISRWGRQESERADDEMVRQVLRDFGIPDAEEDNHKSGVSRCFFRICDYPPGTTSVCECKTDETVIVEPDGYTFSRPKDPAQAAALDEEYEQLKREVHRRVFR